MRAPRNVRVLLRARLDNLSERQRLISENIANASTTGFRAEGVVYIDIAGTSVRTRLALASRENDGSAKTASFTIQIDDVDEFFVEFCTNVGDMS